MASYRAITADREILRPMGAAMMQEVMTQAESQIIGCALRRA